MTRPLLAATVLTAAACVLPTTKPTPDTTTTSSVPTVQTTQTTWAAPTSTGPCALASVRRIGGPTHDSTQLLEVASDGALLVGGYFRETLVLGAGAANETTLTAVGVDNDGIVIRYDADGAFEWVAQIGSGSVQALAATDDGGVFVAGWWRNDVRIPLGQIGEVQRTSAGETDGYVARFDADGALVWVNWVGGPDFDVVEGLAVIDGDVFVVGRFDADTTIADSLPLPLRAGLSTGFVARFAGADGALQWAESYGGVAANGGRAAADPLTGDLLFVGDLSGSGVAEFPATLPLTYAPPGGTERFVARWSSGGGIVSLLPTAADPVDLDVGADGTLVVAGSFEGEVVFGAGEPTETTLSASPAAAFAAAWAPDGTLTWASVPGWPNGGASAVVVTPDGGAVASGSGFGDDSGAAWTTRFDAAGAVVCTGEVDATGVFVADVIALPDGTYATTGEFSESDATFAPGLPDEVVVPNAGTDGDGFVAAWAL